jgi:hypothetical protein
MSIELQMGDYCTWDNQLVEEQENWIVCQVAQSTKTELGTIMYRLQPIDRQPNGVSDIWVPAREIRSAPGFCMICRRNVGVEDSLLKAHNKGSELCYGSYMPGL